MQTSKNALASLKRIGRAWGQLDVEDWTTRRRVIARGYGLVVAALIILLIPSWHVFDRMYMSPSNLPWFLGLRAIIVAVAIATAVVLFQDRMAAWWELASWINLTLMSLLLFVLAMLVLRDNPEAYWPTILGDSTVFWGLAVLLPFGIWWQIAFYAVTFTAIIAQGWHVFGTDRGNLLLSALFYLGTVMFISVGASLTGWRLQKKLFSLTKQLTEAQRHESALREQALMQQIDAATLKALHARLDPHFLFNCLNNLAELVSEDVYRAEQGILHLAEMFRRVVHQSQQVVVSLADELGLVRCYLELEHIRLGDRLSVQWQVDERLNLVSIPPRTVQILVENAIIHGVARRSEGGTITVRTKLGGEPERLELVVENTGRGIEPSVEPPEATRSTRTRGTGTALADLRERLRLTYGDCAALETGCPDPSSYVATVRIPYRAP